MRTRRGKDWLTAALFGAIAATSGCGGSSEAGTSVDAGTPDATSGGNAGASGARALSDARASEASKAFDPTSIAPCTQRAPTQHGGFVSCVEGYDHRPFAEECGPPITGAPPVGDCDPSRNPDNNDCVADSDCTLHPYGRCNYSPGSPAGPGGCACSYHCASDADCRNSWVCMCSSPTSQTGLCYAATCRTDADCAGNLCAVGSPSCPRIYSCFSARDTCRLNTDCASGITCQPDLMTGVRSCRRTPVECLGG